MEKNIYKIEKELFITSDEEIQEGDYGFDEVHKCVVKITKELINNYLYKKIILTTDQDLIKDGVQSIPNEFLKWFVKNPSCKRVEIQKQYQYHSSKEFYIDADYVDCTKEQYELIKEVIQTYPLRILYKIIIPKEESITCPKCRTNDFKNCHSISCPIRKEESKQETLEEVCDKVLNYLYPNCKKEMSNLQYTNSIISLKYITKWQAERMYNKEEVDKLLDVLLEENMCSYAGDELIRQFKK